MFRDLPYDKLPGDQIWSDPLLVDEYVLPWYANMDHGFSTFVTTIMKGLGYEYEPWYGDQLTVGRRDWYQGDYGNILKSSQQDITAEAEPTGSTITPRSRRSTVFSRIRKNFPNHAKTG